MAKTKDIANDPQEKKKVKSHEAINMPEVAAKESKSKSELDNDSTKEISSNEQNRENSDTAVKVTNGYSQLSLSELLENLQKRVTAEKWYSDDRNIKEIINTFEKKFKTEIQEKKEAFIKEGGNEIDFYFKPQYKNTFDQTYREYKNKRRTFFHEREESQKLNLVRKLEIIESLKELINIDENINYDVIQ